MSWDDAKGQCMGRIIHGNQHIEAVAMGDVNGVRALPHMRGWLDFPNAMDVRAGRVIARAMTKRISNITHPRQVQICLAFGLAKKIRRPWDDM